MQKDPTKPEKQFLQNLNNGLGMFWWSKGFRLQNISLFYEIMMIC